MSLETTRERKEKGGERGEKKTGLLALIIFILPTLEIVSERQKSARDTPLGHLNRAVPFSKIRLYIYIYIYIYINNTNEVKPVKERINKHKVKTLKIKLFILSLTGLSSFVLFIFVKKAFKPSSQLL